MPHDANGSVLAIGDKVVIPGIITVLLPSEDNENCSVLLEHLMPPHADKVTVSAINTKQVVRVEGAAEAEPPEEPPEEEEHGHGLK